MTVHLPECPHYGARNEGTWPMCICSSLRTHALRVLWDVHAAISARGHQSPEAVIYDLIRAAERTAR